MQYKVIVKGIPKSVNSSPTSRRTWMTKVAEEARKNFGTPLQDDDLRVEITIFHNGIVTFDSQNMAKPICDALCGVAYVDDMQVMEAEVKRKNLDGTFHIKGVPEELAIALCQGEDFVQIVIKKVGNEVEQL